MVSSSYGGTLDYYARQSAKGYIQNRYHDDVTYPSQTCDQVSSANTYVCGFEIPNVVVTVTFTTAKGGYLINATES